MHTNIPDAAPAAIVVAAARELFRVMAENELLNLHEGNFARYQIRPAEFADWQTVWQVRP
jgi:hypothetical protein